MDRRVSVPLKAEPTEESGPEQNLVCEADKRTSGGSSGLRKRDFDSVTGTRPKKLSVRTDFGRDVAYSEHQFGEFHRPGSSFSDTTRRPEDVDPNYVIGFQRYIELRKCHISHRLQQIIKLEIDCYFIILLRVLMFIFPCS